eukprot:1160629-Pelagomonas_calceolata.AAC.1
MQPKTPRSSIYDLRGMLLNIRSRYLTECNAAAAQQGRSSEVLGSALRVKRPTNIQETSVYVRKKEKLCRQNLHISLMERDAFNPSWLKRAILSKILANTCMLMLRSLSIAFLAWLLATVQALVCWIKPSVSRRRFPLGLCKQIL